MITVQDVIDAFGEDGAVRFLIGRSIRINTTADAPFFQRERVRIDRESWFVIPCDSTPSYRGGPIQVNDVVLGCDLLDLLGDGVS